ncbi:MAG: DUF2520 domain-containing protein [Gaiella sp.]
MRVVGARGRVGNAISARLAERGVRLDARRPEVVLLCVPDRAIVEAARQIPPGPWVGHVSGATPLAALDPHTRRFSVHPLQTFTLTRGADQLDGAWAAITAETDEAAAVARRLAETLGLRPFALADTDRVVYHAGAALAANYLVTLEHAAAELLATAGAPREALVPLLHRVIDNGFALTGPIERGDVATVTAHRSAIATHAPHLAEAYDALAVLTVRQTASAASDDVLRALRQPQTGASADLEAAAP